MSTNHAKFSLGYHIIWCSKYRHQILKDAIEVELKQVLAETDSRIIALGGGAWITDENRQIIKNNNCVTIWLESTFEHCWRNINISKQERPLAKDRLSVQKLFEERQKIYCLADWHLVVKPELTSLDLAKFIAEEIL